MPGGAVRSAELIEPGFVNDMFSAFYPFAAASPVDHGPAPRAVRVALAAAPLVLAHPAPDGTCPVVSTDLDETAASLDACHPGDGDAWRGCYARWTRLRGGLLDGLFTPIPPITATARLARRPRGPMGRLALRAFALLSVRRLGEEEFASDAARRLFAGAALHADLSPDDVLSGFFGWILCTLGQDVGWPVPEGGAGRLADALVNRLRAKGGGVECDAPVDKVIVRDGRAVAVRCARRRDPRDARACSPTSTRPRCSSTSSAPNTSRHESSTTSAASSGTTRWSRSTGTSTRPFRGRAPTRARAGTLHLVESVDALTESSAADRAGLVPGTPVPARRSAVDDRPDAHARGQGNPVGVHASAP